MTPLLLLLGSLAFSLAFNVAWAWGGAVLSVIAAAACTLIVPAGLHLWPQIPASSWELRALRALVMTGICTAAAVSSFSHAVSVLLASGWTEFTAWSVTGGAELLVALSTMALRTPVQERAAEAVPVDVQQPVQAAVQTPDTPDQTPYRRPVQAPTDTPRQLSAVDPDRSTRFHAWASTLPERPTEYAVRKEFGCRQSVAKALLAELDEDADDRAAV